MQDSLHTRSTQNSKQCVVVKVIKKHQHHELPVHTTSAVAALTQSTASPQKRKK